jgi:hypothetical protein
VWLELVPNPLIDELIAVALFAVKVCNCVALKAVHVVLVLDGEQSLPSLPLVENVYRAMRMEAALSFTTWQAAFLAAWIRVNGAVSDPVVQVRLTDPLPPVSVWVILPELSMMSATLGAIPFE